MAQTEPPTLDDLRDRCLDLDLLCAAPLNIAVDDRDVVHGHVACSGFGEAGSASEAEAAELIGANWCRQCTRAKREHVNLIGALTEDLLRLAAGPNAFTSSEGRWAPVSAAVELDRILGDLAECYPALGEHAPGVERLANELAAPWHDWFSVTATVDLVTLARLAGPTAVAEQTTFRFLPDDVTAPVGVITPTEFHIEALTLLAQATFAGDANPVATAAGQLTARTELFDATTIPDLDAETVTAHAARGLGLGDIVAFARRYMRHQNSITLLRDIADRATTDTEDTWWLVVESTRDWKRMFWFPALRHCFPHGTWGLVTAMALPAPVAAIATRSLALRYGPDTDWPARMSAELPDPALAAEAIQAVLTLRADGLLIAEALATAVAITS